jgi:hypothetical protein
MRKRIILETPHGFDLEKDYKDELDRLISKFIADNEDRDGYDVDLVAEWLVDEVYKDHYGITPEDVYNGVQKYVRKNPKPPEFNHSTGTPTMGGDKEETEDTPPDTKATKTDVENEQLSNVYLEKIKNIIYPLKSEDKKALYRMLKDENI